ncbi:short-chain dehydrogenase [Gluconacetobacter sacchari DSM 12717]|uniref:SDR family oxidoreductase n=2 Tax=Gluconacetobacter sacchari TaxID=92759 RepID=A0A7W4NPR5_9PROT|nr:SDR family NAD(P)-dependent oxidoreductase [Gluconacetobacter sacchari]MBB2161772.1 SDR family oxidoreductase [Gluconacetobacter sacchari]GBQ20084.1 short-chain dehydrogenase [Gluconacetobacter sacchari DSM 12717]
MPDALVIGAGGGIGRACVAALAARGFLVTAADRSLASAQSAIETLGAGHTAAECNVCNADMVDHVVASRPFAAMVYTAGIVATMAIIHTDFSLWRRIMAINLDGAAIVASAMARQMVERQEGGAMVFVSSAAGVRGEAHASAYSASKAGLIGMVQAVAAELTPHGIRVNAVAPGNVDTPMLREVAAGIAQTRGVAFETVWNALAHAGAAQRLIDPAEVGGVCAALCASEFSAVTGATIGVDAGYMLA